MGITYKGTPISELIKRDMEYYENISKGGVVPPGPLTHAEKDVSSECRDLSCDLNKKIFNEFYIENQ